MDDELQGDEGEVFEDMSDLSEDWSTPEKIHCLDLFRAILQLKNALSDCYFHLYGIIRNITNEKRETLEELAAGYSLTVEKYGEKVAKELFETPIALAESLAKITAESLFSEHDLVKSIGIEAAIIYEKMVSLTSETIGGKPPKRRLLRSFATGPVTAQPQLSKRDKMTWDLYDGPIIVEAYRLICLIGDCHNVELDRMFRKSVTLLPPSDGAGKTKKPPPDKESRNYWLYTLAIEKRGWKQIVVLLAKRIANDKKDWEPILTMQGVKDAIDSFCERHDLPPPAPRKRGRPKRDNN